MAYTDMMGLKEAYDSYRDREADIRRERIEDAELAYQEEMRDREREQYEYGLSRRPFEEKLQQMQFESAQLGLERGQAEFDEWTANAEARKQQLLDQRKLLLQQIDNAGQTYNLNEIKLGAAQGAQKYRDWKTQFMQEGDDTKAVNKLMEAFNSDSDDTNNIDSVEQASDGGWIVRYENGASRKFNDRMEIELMLEQMADPEFHQNYMLNMLKSQADAALAAKKLADENNDMMWKQQKQWESQTLNNTDRLFGKIREGLVDFGEPGAAKAASTVRSIVNRVGSFSKYALDNATVANRVAMLADQMLVTDPRQLRTRAEEYIEELPDDPTYWPPEVYPDGKPSPGDPEYEVAVKNYVYNDMAKQLQALEMRVLNDYTNFNPDTGQASPRLDADSKGEGGDQITTSGLERPGGKEPGTPPTQADVTPSQSDVGLVRPPPEIQVIQQPAEMVSDKRKEYGLKAGGRLPPKASKSSKNKIAKDFDMEFDTWTKQQQGAWYNAFGRYLDQGRRLLAAEKIKGKTNVASQ